MMSINKNKNNNKTYKIRDNSKFLLVKLMKMIIILYRN